MLATCVADVYNEAIQRLQREGQQRGLRGASQMPAASDPKRSATSVAAHVEHADMGGTEGKAK